METKKTLEKVVSVLRNRYAATTLLALFWVMFISDVDVFFIASEQMELNDMRQEISEIKQKNDDLILELIELEENPDHLERVARERYFMKKPQEEVYRIVD